MCDGREKITIADDMHRAIQAFLRRLALEGFRNEQGFQSEEVLASSPEVQALSDAATEWEENNGSR